MSRRVIGMAFTNQARGDKSNNNAIGGIGARGTAVRNAIISRSTNCCNRSFGSSGNENFITLAQALQQGGVFSGQILFLDNNRGLVLINDFIVQNGGFIILADIENPQGNVPSNSRSIDVNKFAGVFVPQGKKLVVHGEIVLGNISSNAANNKDVYGVYNKGTIEISETGSITMGDIRSVNQNAHGIFQESTIQKHTVSNSAGAIQMGNITSENANAFGVKNGDLNDVRVQIGNVSGSGEVAAVNLFDGTTPGNMSAHVIAGDVTNSGTSATRGLYVYNLSGSFICGNVEGRGTGNVDGIIGYTLNGSVTCGNVDGSGDYVYGINVGTLNGSATCGNVEGSDNVYGIFSNTLNGSATCGNVEGSDEVYGILSTMLNGSATCGNVISAGNVHGIFSFRLSGSATCRNVSSAGNGNVEGIRSDFTLSGKAICGDVSSTGTSTQDNVITVTGLRFTIVYPEAQVTIGNISATNGICRGATTHDTRPLAILAGTTNIGDITYDVDGINTGNEFYSGGFVFQDDNISDDKAVSDSFVSYGGIGKGLEFKVRINNSGQYELTDTNFTNTTGYVDGETITINGEFFGGDQTNDVTLTITVPFEDVITRLNITSNIDDTPTTPRVTTTGVITTNGLSGSFSVGNIKHTGTAESNNDAYIAYVTNISGKIAGKNISADTDTRGVFVNILSTGGIVNFGDVRCTSTGDYRVYGVYVRDTLSGSATCGNVSSTGSDRVRGIYVRDTLSGSATCGDINSNNTEGDGTIYGIIIRDTLSGSATCGNVTSTGSGDIYGIYVDDALSGSATCGNVTSTGSGDIYGIYVDDALSGSATCGNVTSTGSGTIYGIYVDDALSGSATCGNVTSTGSGTIYGIYVDDSLSTLSGSATCGDVEGNGLTYGFFIENQVNESGVVIVGNITGNSGSGFRSARTEGGFLRNLNGKVTCGNVKNKNTNSTGVVKGIVVGVLGETGKADCGNVSTEGSGEVYGIQFNEVSGKVTCGDVEGNGITYGVYSTINAVIYESGVVIVGNITGNSGSGFRSARTEGGFLRNLNGKVTCGNVKNKNTNSTGVVKGFIMVNSSVTGKASCGNVSTEGNGDVFGIQVGETGILSGSATCGNVSSEGSGTIFGLNGPGKINGNVIIESAPTGVGSLTGTPETPGTGNVIIGEPTTGGAPGSVDANKLSAYIYGGSVVIPTP